MSQAKKLQLVLAADMTYSMAAIRNEIRRAMEANAKELAGLFPEIEISIMFIGDDKNRNEVYPILDIPLTRDIASVVRFIASAPNALGGGPHANYERALHVANSLKWDADAKKIVLIYGDEVPHEASFKHNDGTSYDWKKELKGLTDKGVIVCGVHCLDSSWDDAPKKFYRELAERSGGSYLTLPQFNAIGDLLMAVAYAQLGVDHLKTFKTSLLKAKRLTRATDSNIATLGGFGVSDQYSKPRADGLVPVQGLLELQADAKIAMPKLMADNGISEAHNVKRYYEFTKKETIQGNKEIVLVERATGDVFTGAAARKLLGLPDGQFEDVRIAPKEVAAVRANYIIYVESTSNNRSIPAGNRILVDLTRATKRRRQ